MNDLMLYLSNALASNSYIGKKYGTWKVLMNIQRNHYRCYCTKCKTTRNFTPTEFKDLISMKKYPCEKCERLAEIKEKYCKHPIGGYRITKLYYINNVLHCNYRYKRKEVRYEVPFSRLRPKLDRELSTIENELSTIYESYPQ